MRLIFCAEINPISDYGRPGCCFNCVECEHFAGLFDGEIQCTLDE